MTRRRSRVLTALGVPALALAMLAVGAMAAGDTGTPDAGPVAPVTVEAAAGAADPAAAVRALQSRLQRLPGDWSAWAALGAAYVQQARVTGDPSGYPKAEQALVRSDALRPGNLLALQARGSLAAARHDFVSAARLSRELLAANPFSADGLAVLSDALIELGQYDEAFRRVDELNALRPGLAAFSRAAYSLELRGKTAPATAAMQRALEVAHSPVDRAIAAFQLGELAWNAGDLKTADRWYTEGARLDATYGPLAVARARLEAARGETEQALASLADASVRQPLPGVLLEHIDLLSAAGRTEAAAAQADVLRAQVRLAEDNGVDVDLELALFEADHGDPASALALAREIHSRRPSIFASDALAWALHVNGRDAEALPHARRALRLGTRSAPLLFHLGMIERATGDDAAAATHLRSALELNPHFSPLHAPVARKTLAAIGDE